MATADLLNDAESMPAIDDIAITSIWLNDPCAFIEYHWPGSITYDKQCEVMESVRDNVETFVHAAHELGKTKLAAWIVIWWISTRFPARVVTTSSSEKQLKSILWAEIDVLIRTSAHPLELDQDVLKLSVMDEERGKPFGEHYAIGHVTKTIENFQGHHLPRGDRDPPRVLFLFDESSAIDDDFYTTIQGQAHRFLAIGNPLAAQRFFYRQCKAGDEPDPDRPGCYLRKVIHIDGLDSPNVRYGMARAKAGLKGPTPTLIPGLLSWPEYKRRDKVWDEVKKRIRLHGLFYEGDDTLLYPPDWIAAAEDAWSDIVHTTRGPCWMGIDVAEGGRDLSVWTVIDWCGIVDVHVMATRNTAVIVPETLRLMQKWSIPSRRVCFDRGAGGKEHADTMRARGQRVRAIAFGEKAYDSKTYKNRRVEMYVLLRKALNPSRWSKSPVMDSAGNETLAQEWRRCFAIPADGHSLFAPELQEEMSVMPMLYDSEGKQYLPPKSRRPGVTSDRIKSLEEIIGRSPDRLDSLVLAVFARDGDQAKRVVRVDKDRVMAAPPPQESRDMVSGLGGQPAEPREPTLADRLFGAPRVGPLGNSPW